MNTFKTFVAAATFALLSNSAVAATEAEPKTQYKLYHEMQKSVTTASASNGIGVYDAVINLIDDYDHDGHYSRFEVNYDADSLSGEGLYVYSVVSLVDDYGHAHELYTSPTFYIYGDTNSDAQSDMITLGDDYASGHFRLRVDLYDACCGALLDTLLTSAQETIPLEGQYYDTTSTYTQDDYYYDGAGGSWGLGGLGVFGLMYALRRRSLQAFLDHDDDEQE